MVTRMHPIPNRRPIPVKSFDELYFEVLVHALKDRDESYLERLEALKSDQMDCLLHPERHPVVVSTGPCDCGEAEPDCKKVCEFHAIHPDETGELKIDEAACVGCELCVAACRAHRLAASKDVIPALRAVRWGGKPAFALVAPAFLGQFGEAVSPGRLRAALKAAGFTGMIEVALLADMLTLKEALEFDAHVKTATDYQLTSCCCPMWIAMIRKLYHGLVPHVPPAVSPMIAAGRMVKTLYPDAVTVFIGPCLAKKSEAREKDVADAIDYVLTFQEMKDAFAILELDPASFEEDDREHASRAGRIYAYAGGVSEAVAGTVERVRPGRAIPVTTRAASGVPQCKAMVADIVSGKGGANFYEGMGCVGGCVGGPRAIIPKEDGRRNVARYGDESVHPTPIDNPYVVELLGKLGFDTIEKLLEESDIFTRTLE